MALCVAVGVAAATPWGSISPLLERNDEWGSSYLPTVPPSSDGASVYGTVASTHSRRGGAFFYNRTTNSNTKGSSRSRV